MLWPTSFGGVDFFDAPQMVPQWPVALGAVDAVSTDWGRGHPRDLGKDGENRPVRIFACFDRGLPRCRARLSEPP
jgi:hypothetical protein